MTIIIDGPDGAGKTTLVKKLKEYYNIDSVRFTYKDPKNFNFYNTFLEKVDCIYDRNFLSELVYPKIFGRTCQLDELDTQLLLNKCKQLNIKIFILITDTEELLNRILTRGGEHQNIIDNIDWLRTEFINLGNKYNIEIIDTSKITFEEIIRKVENNEEYKGS